MGDETAEVATVAVTAATPAEEVPIAIVPEPVTFSPLSLHPKPREVVSLKWPIKVKEDVPIADFPYYLLSSEGLYLVKSGWLGTSVVPTKKMPTDLTSMADWAKGVFFWTGKVIPGAIMSQAVDFFRQVWNKHKTEAELLFMYNEDKNTYRLFCPTQKVSGGSVKSVYEPGDIPQGYYVVGSIHSHCNFGAFHSGTDTNDAATFNGLHITVGHVDKENPEFAVMMSVDGQNFHYNAAAFPLIADITQLWTKPSPTQWFNFLLVDKQVGKRVRAHLQEQLEKAMGVVIHNPGVQPYNTGPHGNSGVQYPIVKRYSTYENWLRFYEETSPNPKRSHSGELRAYFPDEMFSGTGSDKKLSFKFFPEALELLCKDIERVADHFDIEFTWEIDDVFVTRQEARDKDKEVLEANTNKGSEDLLPGAMAVIEAVGSPDEIHRQPMLH